MTRSAYDHEFYNDQRLGSQQSADVIVPLVLAMFPAKSVLDVGCGVGTWLNSFERNGVEDVTGLDGDYVSRESLVIPARRFKPTDLTADFGIEKVYDVACCLEVVEHLPPNAGGRLVLKLCQAAPVVMFSAAIPGQSGTDHVNEAWQDHWRLLFEDRGYRAVDMVRPAVWNDHRVKWWYQQNTLVYVDEDMLRTRSEIKAVDAGTSLNAVHVDCYKRHVAANEMYFSKAIKQLPGHLVNAVRRRMGA